MSMFKKKNKKSTKPEGAQGEGGELHLTAVGARNLSGADGGAADLYCVLTCSFNKQRFKSKITKKTLSPSWNEEFVFYVAHPHGELYVKLWAKVKWKSDDLLGEVTVPLGRLANGEVWEDWFDLDNEPSKKKKASDKAQIKLKLHFPVPEKDKKASATKSAADTPKKAPESNEKKTVAEVYDIGGEIGRGGFSIVYSAKKRTDGSVVAIKVIEKDPQHADELQLLQREIDIMRKLRHKNIIALYDVYDEPEKIYLVMELVTGGELFDQIVARGTYSERDAANTIRQILEAVEYMHANGIAHRDLKPENLLCSGSSNEIIKVTDFGLSKDFATATLKTSCGTPDYVAPEVLKGQPYDNSVDIWSIGVITYILLCGFPPFYGTTDQQIFEKILKGQYDFPSPDWDGISPEAKQFIKDILVLDFNQRPTAAECLETPWIQNKAPEQTLNRLESFRAEMTDYTTKRKKQVAAAKN